MAKNGFTPVISVTDDNTKLFKFQRKTCLSQVAFKQLDYRRNSALSVDSFRQENLMHFNAVKIWSTLHDENCT